MGFFHKWVGLHICGLKWTHRQSNLLHNVLFRTLYLSRQTTVLLNPLYLTRTPVSFSAHGGSYLIESER